MTDDGSLARFAYPGVPASAVAARRDLAGLLAGCPAADEALLWLSEVTANAILYTRSGQADGEFTVTVSAAPRPRRGRRLADQGAEWGPASPMTTRPAWKSSSGWPSW